MTAPAVRVVTTSAVTRPVRAWTPSSTIRKGASRVVHGTQSSTRSQRHDNEATRRSRSIPAGSVVKAPITIGATATPGNPKTAPRPTASATVTEHGRAAHQSVRQGAKQQRGRDRDVEREAAEELSADPERNEDRVQQEDRCRRGAPEEQVKAQDRPDGASHAILQAFAADLGQSDQAAVRNHARQLGEQLSQLGGARIHDDQL